LNGTGPQPPSVTLARASNNTLIFSWPTAADGYVLQSTDALGSPTWTDVTEAVVPSGDQNTVTVTTSGNARFFRLVKAP